MGGAASEQCLHVEGAQVAASGGGLGRNDDWFHKSWKIVGWFCRCRRPFCLGCKMAFHTMGSGFAELVIVHDI